MIKETLEEIVNKFRLRVATATAIGVGIGYVVPLIAASFPSIDNIIQGNASIYNLSQSFHYIHLIGGASIGYLIGYINERNIRKKEEENIRLLEQIELSNSLLATKDAIYLLDRNCWYQLTNEGLNKTLGKNPEEIIGKHYSDFHPSEEDVLNMQTNIDKVYETGEYAEFEQESSRAPGKYFLKTLTPVFDISGKVKYVTVVSKDITNRVKAEKALKKSEERFRTLIDMAPMGLSLIDKDNRYEYINPAFLKIFGYDLSDIPTGKEWLKAAYPDPEYRRKVITAWKEDLKSHQNLEIRSRTYEVMCKDGVFKTIQFMPVTLPSGNQFIIYEDITKQKQIQETLRKSEEKYKRLFENAPAGIFQIDCATNRYIYVNEVFCGYLGRSEDEIRKIIPLDNLSIESQKLFLEHLKEVALEKKASSTLEYELIDKLGKPRWIRSNNNFSYSEDGRVKTIDAVTHDITQQKELEEKLRELSTTDALTGLYNQRSFYEQITKKVNHAHRYDEPLSLLLLDVDDFKIFNDRYGHLWGDVVLRKLGEVIRSSLNRPEDNGYRYGGEEFTVILPHTDLEGAVEVAERIRETFAKEVFNPSNGDLVSKTVSIGVAELRQKETCHELTEKADICMYDAKKAGKDRVHGPDKFYITPLCFSPSTLKST